MKKLLAGLASKLKGTKVMSSKRGSGRLIPSFISNFNWNQFIENTFSHKSRAIIHKCFIATLIGSGTYVTGKMAAITTTNLLTDSDKSKPVKQTYVTKAKKDYGTQLNKIKDVNLFNAKTTGKVLPTETGPSGRKVISEDAFPCEESSKLTKLPLKLITTIVLQNSRKSIAAIEKRGEKELLELREGDKILKLGKIGKIDRQVVIFRNLKSGICEYIENTDEAFEKKFAQRGMKILDPKSGRKLMQKRFNDAIRNKGNNYKIKKSFRDELLKDGAMDILTQAKAITIRNPDGSLSFKMTEIAAGSVYSSLNIQDGDIIDEINGSKIKSMNEIMGLFGRIKEIDSLQLGIKRNGQLEKFDYEFD